MLRKSDAAKLRVTKVGFTVYHLVLLCGQREYRQGKQQCERDSFELIHNIV